MVSLVLGSAWLYPRFHVDARLCTAISVPGLMVQVRDAATGAPIASESKGFAISGGVSLPLESSPRTNEWAALHLSGAHERPGIYTIVVEREGYFPTIEHGVEVVKADECHVATTTVETVLVAR